MALILNSPLTFAMAIWVPRTSNACYSPRTVMEWSAEQRMAEARRLLVETDESVEHIGGSVGYDDPTYFARRFRSIHGETPAAWRAANR